MGTFIGGAIGGIAGSKVSKKALDKVIDDDLNVFVIFVLQKRGFIIK
ncbi:hypothetical protein [Gracilibacillus sp. YIM 98692]|nr:hypothetical protein [Gracilibacillus sp. YIM 98692]